MSIDLLRPPLALRTRLTIWFAASVLLILAPFLAGLLAVEWQAMRRDLDEHLREDLDVAVQMLTVRGGAVVWRADADGDAVDGGTLRRWIEVYDEFGRALYLRGTAAEPGVRQALRAPGDDELGFRTTTTPAGASARTFAERRRVGDVAARIRVARTEDHLRTEFRRLALLVWLLAPLAVLAAATAGYVITGVVLAPLSRMAERARTISAERLSERLPIENPVDELGQLAVVFNEMFGRIEEGFDRLKRFTADASHELRTPLTAIRSVGEVGLREARSAEEYQEVIGSMLEEADRLARLVDALLTIARWESGRVRAAPETIDLGRTTRDVAAQLAVLAEDRGVTLSVDAAHPARAWADPMMIRQAVINVLDNALKFTRDGSRVEARVDVLDGMARLTVDDEGPGIPPEERSKVVERFYRVGGDRKDAARGVGLGLAIVQWAVAANAGRMAVGESPSGGARVTLEFPSAPPGVAVAPSSAGS